MNSSHKIGFTYFTSPIYLVDQHIQYWLPSLSRLGGSTIIFQSGFSRAIPEDAFRCAQKNSMEPVVHFTSELPLARVFNDVVVLLDVYAKWGVRHIILGDQPNCKCAWPTAGWHYDNLVDHFLDRFIPLANHALRIGMTPVLPPLQPGGDYWDTAFIELVLAGLKRRQMDEVINKLVLSSYGYTFNKPLSWGMGGPERWPISKPYTTPQDQEDQLGFHNFKWVQAASQRVTGKIMPVMILDAGNPGIQISQTDPDKMITTLREIYLFCRGSLTKADDIDNQLPDFDDGSVCVCTFALDTLEKALEGKFSYDVLKQVLGEIPQNDDKSFSEKHSKKIFPHYLLLPSHTSGVSDVVLNKVRPLIKHLQPTVGFSLEEASFASKVSVYPDPLLFTEELLNQLRSTGCSVEVLPESGIEIATSLQRY